MPFPTGPIDGVEVIPFNPYCDQRGWLAECFRVDECPAERVPTMAYLSSTNPGVLRGPHEHLAQTDWFLFPGPGLFRVVLWDNRRASLTWDRRMVVTLGAGSPAGVIIPPGVVHGYRNVSADPGMSLNFPNKLYRGPGKQAEVDEVRHEADPANRYLLDFDRE